MKKEGQDTWEITTRTKRCEFIVLEDDDTLYSGSAVIWLSVTCKVQSVVFRTWERSVYGILSTIELQITTDRCKLQNVNVDVDKLRKSRVTGSLRSRS